MAVKLVGEVRDYETKMQQASRVTRDSAASISGSLNALQLVALAHLTSHKI